MALNKQPVSINFAQGLDTKTDPLQVPIGKFLSLKNSVYNKIGRLTKRNGFPELPSLPDTSYKFLTTFSGNLTAIGNNLSAYSSGSKTWTSKGSVEHVTLDTLSLIKNNTNQTQCDSVMASNGLICTVYSDLNNSTTTYKYAIADSTTGQNIVAPTLIPVASGVVTGSPRVFLLGQYFVIVFNNVITATNHIQYIAISINSPTTVTANTNISSLYTPSTNVAFDGIVSNNSLFLAWNGSDGGGAIRMTFLTSTLSQGNTVTFAGKTAKIVSVCADETGSSPVIWVSFYDASATAGYSLAVNPQLNTILSPTAIYASSNGLNITSSAQDGILTFFMELHNTYDYDGGIDTNVIIKNTVTQAGSVGTQSTILRSVGLASKSFILGGIIYLMSVYSSANQPTYFLINSNGTAVSKLAYGNARGYLTKGLPSVTLNDTVASVSYLVKDLIEPVNKTQGASLSAVYSQTGVNLASFDISPTGLLTSEIGKDLHINGGFLWMYDGYLPVEHGFHLWPDYVEATTSTSGGSISAQAYFYVATYEWSDNQGNIFRSAPSIPITITTTGATSTNTINVPTLRITSKTANPVKIVLYRWSTAQQTYYQVTSVTAPTLNSTTTDYVAITDTFSDSSIIGNSILYTTGGVVENIAAPACSALSLFKSRLFLIDSEDKNLLWYSKQVIESTPVEMSDLFTLFVAPTTGAQGDTGPMLALSSLDDKLIIFKKDAIYYITGTGPDNTGANNDFSDPIFVTSTVGCAIPSSIVFIPQGLMFQSDKGIWLLGRDLSTQYIGAPVEDFNQYTVLSALNIPGTNQVRFTLSNGSTLMYDYFYNQWGEFEGIPAISSTLFQDLHTFIDQYGRLFQESPGTYLDGSRPVLMSFTTSWLNLMGLQGYQKAYYFYLLGEFLSPHKLQLQIAYDYSPGPSQAQIITPSNYSAPYGGDATYGASSVFGGPASLEQWRVFLQQKRCQAFQITVNELFDSSFGSVAGAGLTLSGINLVVGAKKGFFPIPAKQSVG